MRKVNVGRTINDISKERYIINKSDDIVLYGWNEYCREQVDRLERKGYSVSGIVDRNATNISQREYKNIRLVQTIMELKISSDSVVFVMLQNGMLHWQIALDMYKRGIERIVFLPMNENISSSISSEFILQYNYMISGDYEVMRVPYVSECVFAPESANWRIAKILSNGEFIVWVSKEMIRTTLREPEPYRDIFIDDFIPYKKLFSFLSGHVDVDISEYVRLYGKVPYLPESNEAYDYVIEKRKCLYSFFESRYCEGDMQYFEVASPKVVWNEKGYFNLCEGQHRCVYLISKGMTAVPVRMTEENIEQIAQLV